MNILIIGSGGREHALAWKAAQSPAVDHVWVAPGNAGTAMEAKVSNLPIGVDQHQALLDFAQQNQIELTIIGPEAPLVAGIVDRFQAAGLNCFGPSRAAAQLEGSKSFSKDFLARHHIPTADYRVFEQIQPALDYLKQTDYPIVIKADGLAAGKGVIIAQDQTQAEQTVRDMLAGNRFGPAGHRILIEEYLSGEEASFIVMVDGQHILPMASSQDHKPVGEGDTGPNTGGMGAYSPAPIVSPEVHQKIMEQVIKPTVQGMASEGRPYTGFLYAGLMIDSKGQPKVLEFNCRFGDPETQPIMMRMESDLIAHCLAALEGKLDQQKAVWKPESALGVVMAAGGYPNEYRKGDRIQGLPVDHDRVKVFHAGTEKKGDQILTAGGRVLCVTALGDDLKQAQQTAYQTVQNIHWPDCYYRRDIGFRAL